MLTDLFAGLPEEVVESLNDFHVEVSCPKAAGPIHDLMQSTVLQGGKRLRPLLTYLMGEVFGAKAQDCHVLARSIEQVHAASLAHDDVIDNATTRRGLASINIQGSNKKAVLAGDYLLADVILVLSRESSLKVVQEMAKVIQDLAQGEWVQWEAADQRTYSPEILEEIALKKTASVMSWCCLAPAIIADQSEERQKKASEFGRHLGLAFQQMDDTLDFSESSLKDQSLDLSNEQVNFVMFEWLCEKTERMQAYQEGASLVELAKEGSFEQASLVVERRAQDHLQRSRELLEELTQGTSSLKAKKSLELMLDFLGERSF